MPKRRRRGGWVVKIVPSLSAGQDAAYLSQPLRISSCHGSTRGRQHVPSIGIEDARVVYLGQMEEDMGEACVGQKDGPGNQPVPVLAGQPRGLWPIGCNIDRDRRHGSVEEVRILHAMIAALEGDPF